MSIVIRVTTTGAIGGYVQQNVLHFTWLGDGPFDLSDAAVEIRDHWIQLIKPLQASDFRYSLITVRNMNTLTLPPFSLVVSINGGGGTVLNWWGPMSVVFSIRTATFGRKGRGRFYVGGFYVGQVGQGQFTSSAQSFNAGMAANLEARYVAVGAPGNFRLGVAPRLATADNFKFATQIIPAPTPGVQRRRNFGVGI